MLEGIVRVDAPASERTEGEHLHKRVEMKKVGFHRAHVRKRKVYLIHSLYPH